MIPRAISEAAERDAVLTALLHLRSRGVMTTADVYAKYIEHTQRALVRWGRMIQPQSDAMTRLLWLMQSHGAADANTVLWLSWLARYTVLAVVNMQERGLPPRGRDDDGL